MRRFYLYRINSTMLVGTFVQKRCHISETAGQHGSGRRRKRMFRTKGTCWRKMLLDNNTFYMLLLLLQYDGVPNIGFLRVLEPCCPTVFAMLQHLNVVTLKNIAIIKCHTKYVATNARQRGNWTEKSRVFGNRSGNSSVTRQAQTWTAFLVEL